jgi:hypothetical protein
VGKIHKETKMVRKIVRAGFFSIGLSAALIPFVQSAAAESYSGPPKPTIQDYGVPAGKLPSKGTPAAPAATTGKCGNPAGNCLFYGGDFIFNPLYPNIANALANESTTEISGSPYGAATWVPFTVPAGETWEVTGLFTNNLSEYGVLDQGAEPLSVAYWSINEGVFPGSAGTVLASGTSPATSTPTGRAAFEDSEYTIQVTGLSVTLSAGSYWLAVVPICTNPADPFCEDIFFLSDVEYINTTPTNAFGPVEPVDAAYLDSAFFGLSFDPANGEVGACAGEGCDAFSAGVLGRKAAVK